MNLWRERIQRWSLPVARRTPFSPNSLSIAAGLLNLSGAAILASARTHPSHFLVAWIPIAIGGALDALDGAVARARGLESRLGDFVDHFIDRVSDLALLAGWCLGAAVRPSVGFVALVAVMLLSYAGTQIEASFGSRSYEGTGRGEFVLALIALPILMFSFHRLGLDRRLWLGLRGAEWATVLLAIVAGFGILQRLRLAIRLSREDR